MREHRLLAIAGVLALGALSALGGKCPSPVPTVAIAYDPYASVDWDSDVRCKTQFHDHIDVFESRLQAYDDAGYCAVSFMTYSGIPGMLTSWKELHWPPEAWFARSAAAQRRSSTQAALGIAIGDPSWPGPSFS